MPSGRGAAVLPRCNGRLWPPECLFEFIVALKIHPESGCADAGPFESDGQVGADASFPVQYAGEADASHAEAGCGIGN